MAYSTEELEIIKAGIEAGKNRDEIKDAVIRYRTGFVPTVKETQVTEKPSVITRIATDVPSDIAETGKGVFAAAKETQQKLAEAITTPDLSLSQRIAGALVAPFQGVARSASELVTGTGKLLTTDEFEKDINTKIGETGAKIVGSDFGKTVAGIYDKLPETEKYTFNSIIAPIAEVMATVGTGGVSGGITKTLGDTIKRGIAGVATAGIPEALGVIPKTIKGAGSALYKTAITPTVDEAKQILRYRANTPFLTRVSEFGENAPLTRGQTALEKGIAGTESMIGVQARKEADKLWNKEIAPLVKNSDVQMTKDELFTPALERIASIEDPTRKKAMQDAFDALIEDYADYPEAFGLEQAQKLKRDPSMQFAQAGAGDVMRGAFDTKFGPVANSTYKDITAPQTSLVQARQSQGMLDPTGAMSRMLSGRPDNPYLNQQASAITNQLTRNLNEQVMPGIRSEALASGQYGGSRQGIAEGLAASRLNQDLAPALTNLYGGAYENAQQRMYGTANALNDQAFQNAQQNANRQFSGDQFNASNNLQNNQFNANLGLQNNAQQMQMNSQNLQNRLQGLGALGTVQNMQDNNFGRYMDALQASNSYNWNQLANYSGIVQPGASMGGTQSQTNYKNVDAGAFGGALSGAGMGAMVGGPMGAAIGGGLGLLGGLF